MVDGQDLWKLKKNLKKFTTKEVSKMSMTERLLFWIAIVVLLVSVFGVKKHVSELETKVSQVQTQSGGQQ